MSHRQYQVVLTMISNRLQTHHGTRRKFVVTTTPIDTYMASSSSAETSNSVVHAAHPYANCLLLGCLKSVLCSSGTAWLLSIHPAPKRCDCHR
jgi:hypothetical protein